MYSKQEAKNIRQSFWTAFGQYMKPFPSAGGEKPTWVNYKTGVPHIFFRMEAGREGASVAIECNHPSEEIRRQQFARLQQLKNLLHEMLGEAWTWEKDAVVEGRTVSRVQKELHGINIFRQSDWPAFISFFKPRMVALDAFWTDARYGFE